MFAVILSEPHEIRKSEDRTEEKNRHRKFLDELQHILNELQHILDELQHILDELQHILNELQHILDVPRSPFTLLYHIFWEHSYHYSELRTFLIFLFVDSRC